MRVGLDGKAMLSFRVVYCAAYDTSLSGYEATAVSMFGSYTGFTPSMISKLCAPLGVKADISKSKSPQLNNLQRV